MIRALLSVLLLLVVTACATSPEGRTQLAAPAPLQGLSAVYSEFDMQLQLVSAADLPACQEAKCVADRAFDQRMLALGGRLTFAAFRQYADLYLRIPRFEFIVADKADLGATSSSGGTVVIYRGLQNLNLDDAVLAFVLAREMSHVIAGHHDENVTASILVAVAAQILFPALNIGGLFASGAASAAASSAASATVATSAASFLGSRALRASYRPQQEREAGAMAMKLLADAGWTGLEVSEKLESIRPSLSEDTAWTKELRESTLRVASMMQGPLLPEFRDPSVQVAAGLQPGLPSPIASTLFETKDQIVAGLPDLPPPMVSALFGAKGQIVAGLPQDRLPSIGNSLLEAKGQIVAGLPSDLPSGLPLPIVSSPF